MVHRYLFHGSWQGCGDGCLNTGSQMVARPFGKIKIGGLRSAVAQEVESIHALVLRGGRNHGFNRIKENTLDYGLVHSKAKSRGKERSAEKTC